MPGVKFIKNSLGYLPTLDWWWENQRRSTVGVRERERSA